MCQVVRYSCFSCIDFVCPIQQCRLPHGRVLGGGSSVNGMLYVRGSPRDFDQWAHNGCDGWSYQDVLPYFKKAEHMHDDKMQNQGT